MKMKNFEDAIRRVMRAGYDDGFIDAMNKYYTQIKILKIKVAELESRK